MDISWVEFIVSFSMLSLSDIPSYCQQDNFCAGLDVMSVFTELSFDKPNYKNLFLRKKSNRPRAELDLARVEKGEVIPDNTAPKSYFPLIVENYY